MGIVFCDGQFLLCEEVKLSFTDRAFLYGDGVFTTVRVSGGVVECWDLHQDRLRSNCAELNIAFPSVDPEVAKQLIELNGAEAGLWRLKVIITGGESPGLDLAPRTYGHLMMTLTPFQPPPMPYTLALFPTPVIRPTAHIKSLSYLDRLWVMAEGKRQGFHDAITTTSEGFLLEAAYSNIFWRQGEDLFTPADTLPLLPGISLQRIKQNARALGMQVHEVRSTLDDIPPDAQVFIANAMVRFHPVERIKERAFVRDLPWEDRLRRMGVYRQGFLFNERPGF